MFGKQEKFVSKHLLTSYGIAYILKDIRLQFVSKDKNIFN